jgi:hypothetical protein
MRNGKPMLAAFSSGLLVVGLYVGSHRASVFGLDDNPGTGHNALLSRGSKAVTFVPGANRGAPVNFSLLSDRLIDPSNEHAHLKEHHRFLDHIGDATPGASVQGFSDPGQVQIGHIPTAPFVAGPPMIGGSPFVVNPPILSGPANLSGPPVNVLPITGDPPIVGDPVDDIPRDPIGMPGDPPIVGDPAIVHTPEPATILLFAFGLVLLIRLIPLRKY